MELLVPETRTPASPQTRFDPRTNTPVVDCTVTVRHYLGTETVQTDAAGEFRLRGLNELDGQFLMIRAVPPATHVYRGLAAMGFTPIRVDTRREVTERFYLVRGGTLSGRLLDAQGRAVDDTWVQLCRVDEAPGADCVVSEAGVSGASPAIMGPPQGWARR